MVLKRFICDPHHPSQAVELNAILEILTQMIFRCVQVVDFRLDIQPQLLAGLHRNDSQALLVHQGLEVWMQQDSQARDAAVFGLARTDDPGT